MKIDSTDCHLWPCQLHLATVKLQKETKESPDAHGRWYGDACGAAFALELLGERWTLLIVRELMLGARRFSGLRADLPGISAKVLTERLTRLEDNGVVARRMLPEPAKVQVYELTDWGRAAMPAIRELVLWAMRCGRHDPSLPMTATAFVLTLPMTWQGGAAEPFVLALETGAHRAIARVDADRITVEGGEAKDADAIVRAERGNAMLGLFYGRTPFDAWLAGGEGRAIEGDRAKLSAMIERLQWPEKIAP